MNELLTTAVARRNARIAADQAPPPDWAGAGNELAEVLAEVFGVKRTAVEIAADPLADSPWRAAA